MINESIMKETIIECKDENVKCLMVRLICNAIDTVMNDLE